MAITAADFEIWKLLRDQKKSLNANAVKQG